MPEQVAITKTCFLGHAFRGHVDRLMETLKGFIEEECGYRVPHLKDPKQFRGGQLLDRIMDMIKAADAGLYEITSMNGNVMLELGCAMGARRPYFVLKNPDDVEGQEVTRLLRQTWWATYRSEKELFAKARAALGMGFSAEVEYCPVDLKSRDCSACLGDVREQRRQACLVPANHPSNRQDTLPEVTRVLQDSGYEVSVVRMEEQNDVEELCHEIRKSAMVIGDLATPNVREAPYLNAEVALALGIACGIGKRVVVLQKDRCTLSDIPHLCKEYRDAGQASQNLARQLASFQRSESQMAVESALRRGKALLRAEKFEAAVGHFDRVLITNPDLKEAKGLLQEAIAKRDRFWADEIRDRIQTALDVVGTGDYDAAIHILDEAQSIAPESVVADDAWQLLTELRKLRKKPPADQDLLQVSVTEIRIHSCEGQLLTCRRNLAHLQEQAAKYGASSVPVWLRNQVNDEKARIHETEIELQRLRESLNQIPSDSTASARQPDDYSSYETGLRQLLGQIGQDHARYSEALIYQQRLLENINRSRRYGDTDARKAERAEIIDRLNELALFTLGVSFNELCTRTRL